MAECVHVWKLVDVIPKDLRITVACFKLVCEHCGRVWRPERVRKVG